MRAGFEPKCTTLDTIQQAETPLELAVPTKFADLNPLKEFTNRARYL
jgi:hypothetical protein